MWAEGVGGHRQPRSDQPFAFDPDGLRWHAGCGAERSLFASVVKGLGEFSWMPVLVAWLAWPEQVVVGWGRAREWLVRRAGLWGVSRPRWGRRRSPFVLPRPPARARPPGGRLGAGAGVVAAATPA